MPKALILAFLLLTSVCVLAQGAPVLDVFTNPDGAFQFSYPDNYELLVGERILKATQGRDLGFAVCDFSKALVCVIYPIERLESENLEAAGFSVDVVPGITAESDCLRYTDRLAQSLDEHSRPSSLSIRGRVFRHISLERKMEGHAQFSDFYRAFEQDHCYELSIQVSLSEQSAQQRASSKAGEKPTADGAREALKLILSSVVFK
jgi:hypothetical protein